MFYSKKKQPLDEAIFQNPTSEYRGAPFWAWNTALDQKELLWQIEQLKQMGFGGFHMHVRTGLADEYLGEEFMQNIAACVKKARDENMLAWLYDEDRWPSGAAGGLVTKNPAYRMRHLLLTRRPYGEAEAGDARIISGAGGARTNEGELLARYDICLSSFGELDSYRRIAKGESAKGFCLYAYIESASPSPWFNHQTYVDTLNPEAVKRFIEVTYDRYQEKVGKAFGSVVPAIFTDEPQFSNKDRLGFANEEKDVTIPWTIDIPKTYYAAYKADILDTLPELLWDIPDDAPSLARYRYHDHVAERFASAFADQCGSWCEKNGLMLTGHMMEEPTLHTQTAALGDAMRSYRSFQLPGIDMLCDYREVTTAKQAQSAARQFGRPGVLSELYGVTNWDFDFRGHKLQGDWQAALGVTVRTPHLSWVSMNGEAKRDYPATFNYQSPWYKEYAYIEDHFARINTAMTRGQAVCRVGVIHPIESYWLHWGPRETSADICAQMDSDFQAIANWLLQSTIDYDWIAESLLPIQCNIKDITEDAFPVGEMRYQVLLAPPVETLRGSTVERLQAFVDVGGQLLFLGDAPKWIDAKPDERGAALWKQARCIPFSKLSLRKELAHVRDIEIRNQNGEAADEFVYQLRADGNAAWLFIAQAGKPDDIDIPPEIEPKYQIRVRGEYSVMRYDTLSGAIERIDAVQIDGWTLFSTELYPHDSLLVKLEKPGKLTTTHSAGLQSTSKRKGRLILPVSPVSVTLHEPNVLLLDLAAYALDDEPYRPVNEILRLDNQLRGELNWPLRGEAYAQPWVEKEEPLTRNLRLCFTIHSELNLSGMKLAMENAAQANVHVNGKAVGEIDGWYVDKCIQTLPLPELLAGENKLELTMPYGKKTDVEACYLLGDFGVKVSGYHCVLTPPIRKLHFGDVTKQGLPFYGGNLTYHIQVETKGVQAEIEASAYRAHLLRVAVDGNDVGAIAFSPYRLLVNGLTAGRHDIDITCFGSRVNTFGQLHRADRTHPWWGPHSWRSEGASWTWEYRFWEQGILKSPEILDIL